MKKWLAAWLSAVLLTMGMAACGSSGGSGSRNPRGESAAQSESAASGTVTPRGSFDAEKIVPYGVDLRVEEISAPSLLNNLIGEPDIREISVLLPQSYHENERAYPVLYFLNGYGSPHENSAELFRNAMMALSTEDLIVVCVDAVSRLNCSYYVNSPVTGNWQDFVTKDVVGYIDSSYRTIAEASGRGISGHSVGGFGAMNIALNTEGVFSHVYAMSPAVLAPDGLADYGLRFEPVYQCISEYRDMSGQEARERYLKKLDAPEWNTRYAFDYGSAFAYDAVGKAPYILLPERRGEGDYRQDAVWEQYQNGLGGPPQRLAENRDLLLKLDGLVVEYGRWDELTWVLNGCVYLARQLEEQEIPFDLRVYDGDHTSEIPKRLVTDVLPYFSMALGVKSP